MSTIENGLRADVMRQRMEDKNSLDEGCIYIGTGKSISLDNVTIKETKGMKLSEAIQQYGGKDSYPLSDALNPQLLNTNPVNGEKKTISFYTEGSSVDLGNDCIVPSNSQGIIISNGASNITLYYSDAVEAGAFFYNGSTWDRLTQKIKTNSIEPSSPSSVNLGSNDNRFKTIYANILDSETMKTTNDGLIPKTTESVNLGSGNNLFNTVYAKYFSIPGQCLNFRYDSDTAVIDGNALDVRFGYDCFRPSGERLPIDEYLFMNGGGVDDEDHLTWIRPKGITPYNNNEVNFNIKEDTDALIFGRQGSPNIIKRYDFKDGKNNTFSPIGRGTISVINRDPDHPAENLDATYSYEFAVPKMIGKDYVDLGNNIHLATYTKGAISSSGNDCAMWACDTTKGRFLFKNNGSWSVVPVEAPSFNATSDKRLKENIVPFTSEKSILDLPVYTFNFKSDKNKKKHVGCLAQDLQEICPDLVNEDSQGYLSIEESKITYLLLEEVKELKKQVEELKGKINELEGK